MMMAFLCLLSRRRRDGPMRILKTGCRAIPPIFTTKKSSSMKVFRRLPFTCPCRRYLVTDDQYFHNMCHIWWQVNPTGDKWLCDTPVRVSFPGRAWRPKTSFFSYFLVDKVVIGAYFIFVWEYSRRHTPPPPPPPTDLQPGSVELESLTSYYHLDKFLAGFQWEPAISDDEEAKVRDDQKVLPI